MATRREIVAVHAAGVIQGVALVTFPAASAIFTSSAHYGLSSTQYGALFLPQAIMAITAALLGAGLTRRLGSRRIFLLGLLANLLSMTLLVVSQFFTADQPLAYKVLLAATTCLGIGFGLTVPALNTLVAAFFPNKVDSAVLVLNALLGLGTTLAPIFVALFLGLGVWWGLPVAVGVLILGLLALSLPLPLSTAAEARSVKGTATTASGKNTRVGRLWLYVAFVLLYGIAETLSGTWASVYMSDDLGASTTLASLALTVFWGCETAGRVLFATVENWLPETLAFRMLPLGIAGAFLFTALLPKENPLLGILAFGLLGLGCSALLPLTVSFGQEEFKSLAASVASTLIACYQMGYGIAAFGVGPLQEHLGISLPSIFASGAVVALAMAALAFVIVKTPPSLPAGSE